jgi:hypothetical protein
MSNHHGLVYHRTCGMGKVEYPDPGSALRGRHDKGWKKFKLPWRVMGKGPAGPFAKRRRGYSLEKRAAGNKTPFKDRRTNAMNKPNGPAWQSKNAKGKFGGKGKACKGIRPYKAVSDGLSPRSPGMRDIYQGVRLSHHSNPADLMASRRLRKKLKKHRGG